ncbi:MAG: extracellular solute-binding protein [Paracoccaceae bacterium]|nr:extracellular solute-binding protein [Paracoccaceae bacterium]MDG2258776.1 extracellular solute-binding protein [Paracoccaceae bacterium]
MMQSRPERSTTIVKPFTQIRLLNALAVGTLISAASLSTELWAEDSIIVSHGYSSYGSLKYGPDFKHLDYVNPDAPKGGEISVWAQGTFDTMNPYVSKGSTGSMASIGYERLFTSTSDEVGSSYCLLCTTIEYPEDESWVTFNIHPDAAFSDGSPLTAHDVVFTHNLFMEQGLPSFRDGVSAIISGVEALDDQSVRFTFQDDAPDKGRIGQAGATVVFPQAWYEETGARLDESRFDIAPGSAAYMLDSYDVNRRIIYKRNPNYWGKDLPINKGRENFDTIRVEYFADSTAAFEAFKAGEFTFRQENSSLSWATAYEFPALDEEWVVKETLENGNLPSATGFIFNLRKEKLQDVRVRQALALMYNFTWTNDTLQYGLFQQRESFWQGSKLAAQGLPEGRELELLEGVRDLVDPTVFTEAAVMPHVSGDRQLDRGNMRKASELLDAAGWIAGDDGIRRKNGETLEIEFIMYSPTFDRILNPYVNNLTRLGIEATYNRIDSAQYSERYYQFDFDMIFGGYRVGLEEGSGMLQKFGSVGLGDVFNPAGYSSEAVDALLPNVTSAETYEEMAAAVRAIDRIMRREMFVVPVWYLGKYWVAYYDMFEHPEELPPYALGHLDFWWFNQDKADALQEAGAFR